MAMVASMICGPLIGNAFSTSSIVAWYECDETSGVRYDATSNDLDLTDNNTVGYATGKVSNACDFVSTNTEYLTRADSSIIPTGSASWSFWINHDDGWKTSNDDLWVKGDGTTNSFRILGADNGMYLTLWNSGGTQVDNHWTGMTLNASTWYHVVYTFDATNHEASLYLNGSLISAKDTGAVTSIRDTSGVMTIGKWPGGTSNNFNGLLDMLSLWNIELSSAEVLQLYNSGLGITFSELFTATTSTSTATTTTSADVSELKWVLELYLAIFMFLIFTWLGYRFTKVFI